MHAPGIVAAVPANMASFGSKRANAKPPHQATSRNSSKNNNMHRMNMNMNSSNNSNERVVATSYKYKKTLISRFGNQPNAQTLRPSQACGAPPTKGENGGSSGFWEAGKPGPL